MDAIFDQARTVNFSGDVYRNIVSLRQSQSLFDDLSPDPRDQQAAIQCELQSKPVEYRSEQKIIDRPWEEALHRQTIDYPFEHAQPSRFSDGEFGVWYGARSIETTVYETVYHWLRFLCDAALDVPGVIAYRRVHVVACDSHLLDLRALAPRWPALVSDDYGETQQIGRTAYGKRLPGLLSQSARDRAGEVISAFTPDILSHPRTSCHLTYRLGEQDVRVERTRNRRYMMVTLSKE